jgi:SOS response regulatory protein OraA/RecX
VIAALVADGTLDDRRVGAAHVRTAHRVKGRGRLRIAKELEARGIDRDLARSLIGEVSAADEAAGIARVLLRKRIPDRLSPDGRRQIFQHLLRRGFTADAIADALRSHLRQGRE